MSRPASPAVVLCLVAALGCGGRTPAARLSTLSDEIRLARAKGAYKCAPRELAQAEARTEFAREDLASRKRSRAETNLAKAEKSIAQALDLSSPDRCAWAVALSSSTGSMRQMRPANKGTDTDGDGIPDSQDGCPNEPEDFDGFQDNDGCPDPDNDNDGILDVNDRCPDQPEDLDGFEDEDGCPDSDNDRDGIPDAADHCPNQPEDPDGHQDNDGCPDPDNDDDGVLDGEDRCPMDAGPKDNDGCPRHDEWVVLRRDRLELKAPVRFAKDRAAILPESRLLLDEVVAVLKAHSSIRLRVEGHMDSSGPRARSIKLSYARACTVREYLVGRGIPSDRIVCAGYGPDQPIETNKTAAGREKNRRVELTITQQ